LHEKHSTESNRYYRLLLFLSNNKHYLQSKKTAENILSAVFYNN